MTHCHLIPTSIEGVGHSGTIARALDLIAGFPLHAKWIPRPTSYQQVRYFATDGDLTITLSGRAPIDEEVPILTTVIVESPDVSAKILVATERPISLETPDLAIHDVRDLYLMAPEPVFQEIIGHSIDPDRGFVANELSSLIAHAVATNKVAMEEIRDKLGHVEINPLNVRLTYDGPVPRMNVQDNRERRYDLETPLPDSVLALPRMGRASISGGMGQDILKATISMRHWIPVPQNPDPMRLLEAHPALLRIASLFPR